MKTINEEILSNCIYVDSLPKVNLSGKFIILKESYNTLAEDWLSFINFYIEHDIPNDSTNKKNILVKFKKSYELYSNHFIGASDKIAEIFGLKNELQVISLAKSGNNYKYIAVTSYDTLIDLFYKSNSLLGNLVLLRTIMDRFFLYQYSNKKLLYPITKAKEGVSRNYQYKHYIFNKDILFQFNDFKKYKNVATQNYYNNILIYLLSSMNIKNSDDIENSDLNSIEKYIKEHGIQESKQGDSYLYILNELRRMLILQGRTDIDAPIDRKSITFGIDKSDPTRFIKEVIDIKIYPNFEIIMLKMYHYLIYLKNDGLTAATIKGFAYHLKIFLKYLIIYHPHRRVDIELMEEIFNPLNKNGILNYIMTEQKSTSGAILAQIARFLRFAELLSPYILKNIPRTRKIKKISARKAMPKHMLRHILDIVVNRPPETNTKWDLSKANLDWWPHKNVYPIFPIMLLLHLLIPIRGAQIRNLCRKKSFELDEYGNVSTIIINTDKNTGRTYLQEIPNVWKELSILPSFLKWHKEYFPHLPAIDYNDDDNSRWEQIVPLIITPKVFKPISAHTHMNYLKKVLMQYQLEVNEKFKSENSDNRIQIIWTKSLKTKMPNNVKELNECTDGFFSKLSAEYDIHSLRVTGATRYLEAGLGISLVMKLTGHSSPDMLLNVYNKLKLEEKRELLATAVNKIFLTDGENTVSNLQNFLLNEIPNNYDTSNTDDIDRMLNDNNLFSLNRKSSSESIGGTKIDKGTDIALTSHPSSWTPMIFGICPGTKCPDGRENRCSLCPYLITGKIFLDGVIHQTNLKLIQFYRLSREVNEEENLKYENSGKGEQIQLLFEEISGWFEIINKIENDLYKNNLLPSNTSQIIGTQITPPEISYLKTNYNAFQMGIEKDNHSLALLTIKAFNICKTNKIEKIDKVLENEKSIIEWLMSIYSDKKQRNLLSDFIEKINFTIFFILSIQNIINMLYSINY